MKISPVLPTKPLLNEDPEVRQDFNTERLLTTTNPESPNNTLSPDFDFLSVAECQMKMQHTHTEF